MKRFILLSFVFLGLGFYELSGGSGFDPETARLAQIEARQTREAERIAALPTELQAARTTVSDAASVRDTAAPRNSEVSRAALNLVAFSAVTGTDAPAAPAAAFEASLAEEPKPDLSTLATTQELSLGALESAPASGGPIVFPGNTIAAAPTLPEASGDIRTVKGSLVNVRSGPGTDFDVVDQLNQSTRVEVLTDNGDGWVELRPLDGETTGWVAAFLLTGG